MCHRKQMLVLLCLALCIVLVISGCGGEKPATDNVADKPMDSTPSPDKPVPSGSYTKIQDFSEAWTALIDGHEPALNAFDAFEEPLTELIDPGIELCFCVNYDLLNTENKDGRHEGKFFILDYPAFVEKKGPQLTFGYEYTRTEAGFNPNWKVGDQVVENGSCDLDKGFFQLEKYTLRDENKTERTYAEIKEVKKGEMICLRIYGCRFDVKMNEQPWTVSTYMRVDKDTMDFVLARCDQGPDFEKLSIADKGVLGKEEVAKMLEDAGFEIKRSGSIADKKVCID